MIRATASDMLTFTDLQAAPEPLSTLQKRVLFVLAALVTVGRLLAVACSPWDWDEIQFSHAVRDYDVFTHQPHPPGFPLFIALARVIHLSGLDEFRSLQVITVAGALALFPAMLFLGRELRLPFATNVIASLLLVHLPNVWFFGGTAFSDVPSLTLVIAAGALLLRGCRSRDAYLTGALLLGIAAGFRTQNLLIGLAPAVIATWCRVRVSRSVVQPLVACVLGGASIVIAYGGAAVATGGWERYSEAVSAHRAYIATIDSFRSAERPHLRGLLEDVFVRPYRAGMLNNAIGVFALAGLIAGAARRSFRVAVTLAMFLPFALAGWLMLDHHSMSRFSVAWSPMISLLAAYGITMLAAVIARPVAWSRAADVIAGLAAAWLVAHAIVWTMPALNQVRRNASPPARALEWITTQVPEGTRIYVHSSMVPYGRFFLSDYEVVRFDDVPPVSAAGGGWVLQEGAIATYGARTFTYRRNNLWRVARKRYFEVSVVPKESLVQFGDGWYDEESHAGSNWRWMGRRSVALLARTDGEARLQLRLGVPLEALAETPTITISMNGQALERFVADDPAVMREYVVRPRSEGANELVVETSQVVDPRSGAIPGESRTLGLRLDSLRWVSR